MTMPTNSIRELIEGGMHPQWRKVVADLSNPLVDRLEEALGAKSFQRVDAARLLIAEVRNVLDAIQALRIGQERFAQTHSFLTAEEDRRENILTYAGELGANARQLRGDRRCLRRFLDFDTMVARFTRRLGERQRELAFLLERLGTVAEGALTEAERPVHLWQQLELGSLVTPLLEADQDSRIATSALRCLASALSGLPPEHRESVPAPELIQIIYRLSQDRERDVWIQCEALALLHDSFADSFGRVARLRFEEIAPKEDDIFVRRRLVPLIAARPALRPLLETAAGDPSPFVRQAIAEALPLVEKGPALALLAHLALRDPETAVRASALLQIEKLACPVSVSELAPIMNESLRDESDEYVLRVAIMVAGDAHAALPENDRAAWREVVLPVLRKVHCESRFPTARRWAAQARERIWCDADGARSQWLSRLRDEAKEIPPGKSRFISAENLAFDDESLGRILSVAAQDDFGFDVVRRKHGFRLIRGHRFGFRIWRFLHELRHPSPDKRQAFRHTVGRIFEGSLRVPSALLSEISQTKVPGEPLTLSQEGGWRPYLPLVDELLSALDENSPEKPLRLITSDGVTTIHPPASIRAKWKAWGQITNHFPQLAQLRNATDPGAYVGALRGLGFACEFAPHQGEPSDPELERIYRNAAWLPIFGMGRADTWERVKEYFYSVYENSLGQLIVFLGLAGAYVLGRHIYLNQKFFRLRRRIPLTVGGWGTRGKSGTERIKAALFNALGHRTLCKTTGCEAMFLFSEPFGKLHELFLFRPYDKVTIWEQLNVVNLAARLRSQVFLWECMGLTPSYVEIIQRHWMKDDLSTLVNTYPDHEDLQGPAGINIPETMTLFLREKGHVITSEQQMTPVLEAAAHRLGSRIDQVGWLQPGLLTPDVLERFPYTEHPNNIALVAELGHQLGIARDFSLKEMADRVVPDLGVLTVHPEAKIDGRALQFANGFSANERYGTLSNWKRLKFDRHDPREQPGVWISVLVNNRDDRIARSQVFATILVGDISVDRIFLTGTNLMGMQGYLREAFEIHAQTLTLFPDNNEPPEEVFRGLARYWRIPASDGELRKATDAMSGDRDLARWREPYETAYREYREFAAMLKTPASESRAALDTEMRTLLWTWFQRKLVVVDDHRASGDEVIHRICDETPPGYLNRFMGLQNIKETGLDVVYRWQDRDSCHRACQKLVSHKSRVAREGLNDLAAFKNFAPLYEEEVRGAILGASKKHGRSDKTFQTQLQLIQSAMETCLEEINKSLDGGRKAGGWRKARHAILMFLEALLDSSDSVRRRWRAARIYRDMTTERISPARAAKEIQSLNKRQKGGWLEKELRAWWNTRPFAGGRTAVKKKPKGKKK